MAEIWTQIPRSTHDSSAQSLNPRTRERRSLRHPRIMQTDSSSSRSATRRRVHPFVIVTLAFLTTGLLGYLRLLGRVQTLTHPTIYGQYYWAGLPLLPEKVITNDSYINGSDPTSDDRGASNQHVETLREHGSDTFQDHLDPNEALMLDSRFANSSSPYSYAFVIGGCDPDRPNSYQNYLFNIAIAAKILRECGSKADVTVLFQADQNAQSHELNYNDLRILHALGVYVYYIPQQKNGQQSFYRTQLDKFRILGFTQYERIIFLDGDVMPLANLDYLFELSMNGTIQENLVLQGVEEPANGGFFMLKPGYMQQMQDIISWRERTALQLPYPYFDESLGWGYAIDRDDPWRAARSSGTNWTFLAAFADQGLLYHYTKYARRSVTILMRNGLVENWGSVIESLPNVTNVTRVRLLGTLNRPFDSIDSGRIREIPGKHGFAPAPANSMVHFTGSTKPWMRGGPPTDCCHNASECCSNNSTRFLSAKHYWFWELSQIHEKLHLDFDFTEHFKERKHQRPPLGLYPVYAHVLNASSNILTQLRRVYPKNAEDFNTLGMVT